jgi:peptide-methionine (S)-S-oxide reductase
VKNHLQNQNNQIMKLLILSVILLLEFTSCVKSQNINIPVGSKENPSSKEAVAAFSEGCFWHSEIIFQSLVGVRDAVSGYAGGRESNPNYEKVSSGTTGHAETVKVYYDPSKISYETLVKAFFASHDPTTINKQGNDIGNQYRSIAFYNNETEKTIIENEIIRLTNLKIYKNKIVTEVIPLTQFYPAEDYHQEFVLHNPENSYVQNVSIPDFIEFKKKFKGNFK